MSHNDDNNQTKLGHHPDSWGYAEQYAIYDNNTGD